MKVGQFWVEINREADGLGAVVDEDGADGHAFHPMKMYIAIVYSIADAVNSALSIGFSSRRIGTRHEQSQG